MVAFAFVCGLPPPIKLSFALAIREPVCAHIPLEQPDQGWFELVTDAAKPGTHYRFRIDGEQKVPDPASRFQPQDVHGPSEVIDPERFRLAGRFMARPPLARSRHL